MREIQDGTVQLVDGESVFRAAEARIRSGLQWLRLSSARSSSWRDPLVERRER
jgi:hypothetical protein